MATATFLLLVATPLQAASYNWAVASGDWLTASNWGGTLPTGSDNAYIVNGGTAAVTLSGAVCQSLYLGDPGSTQSGTVQMSGGDLSASYEYLGYSGTGTLMQTGGTNNTKFDLGENVNSIGAYNLSGSGVLLGSSEVVGVAGTGTFTQSGGTNNVSGFLHLGNNLGSSGSYSLSGSGLLSAGSEYVGYTAGTGKFTQSGGTNTAANVFSLGQGGTYNLNGGALLVLGIQGAGTFNFGGGTLCGKQTSSTPAKP